MKNDSIYIDHINASLNKIERYIQDISKVNFHKNTIIQDAVIRQFEIIGEAAKRVSDDLKIKNPEIPWSDMAGMRDKLIHDYIDVDLQIVWLTAVQDVPSLIKLLDNIRC